MTDNLFELAVRNRYRFQSPPGVNPQGQLNVEQLLDLSIEALDLIAVSIGDKLESKAKTYRSNKTTAAQLHIKNQLELLKEIIAEKEAIEEAIKLDKALLQQQRELDKLIASKQEEATASLPISELEKLRDEIKQKRSILKA